MKVTINLDGPVSEMELNWDVEPSLRVEIKKLIRTFPKIHTLLSPSGASGRYIGVLWEASRYMSYPDRYIFAYRDYVEVEYVNKAIEAYHDKDCQVERLLWESGKSCLGEKFDKLFSLASELEMVRAGRIVKCDAFGKTDANGRRINEQEQEQVQVQPDSNDSYKVETCGSPPETTKVTKSNKMGNSLEVASVNDAVDRIIHIVESGDCYSRQKVFSLVKFAIETEAEEKILRIMGRLMREDGEK